MGMPVVTVAAGGMPVVHTPGRGIPVTIAANGFGTRVTVVSNGLGLPVTFVDLNNVITAPGSWLTTFEHVAAFDVDSPAWSTTPNMRQHLGAALFSQSGSKVRLTMVGPTVEGLAVAAMYIGHGAGASPNINFLSTPVQVKVGNSGTFVIGVGATVVSDEITYAFDKTKPLIISGYFSTAAQDTSRGKNSLANTHNNFFKAGASEVSTLSVTGYTQSPNALRVVKKIEVFAAA